MSLGMKRWNSQYYKQKVQYTIGACGSELEIPGCENQILVQGKQLFLRNVGDGLTVDGIAAEQEEYEIYDGMELGVGAYKILFLKDRIAVLGEQLDQIKSSLLELASEEEPFEDFPRYKRSPRIIKKICEDVITLSRPKELANQKKGSLAGLIFPSLAMMFVTVGVSILMKRGMFILMSVAGTGITMIVSVVKYITDRKEGKEEEAYRQRSYREYLLRKRKEIYEAYKREEAAYAYHYPKIWHIEEMIHRYSERIYERNANEEDFLCVSVGEATLPCKFRIKMSADEWNEKKDPLLDEAREIIGGFSTMRQPVIIDLKKAHVGLVGEKDVIHEQLQLLIAQITFAQSYHDVEIVTVYHEKYEESFRWMKWYPHLCIHAINVLGTVNSERKRDQVLGSVHQILKERKLKEEESKKNSMFLPHFIFVIDEPKLIMDHSIMEYLDKEGYNLGFSIIYTTNNRANLPENVETIVMLENSSRGTLLMEERQEKILPFALERTQGVNLDWMARDLSVLEHMQGISSHIPESITFFDMYHVEHPYQLNVEQRWRQSNSSKSLAVPLGVRAEEDLVYLNLHEKAHGPHGLVAGTTGSGKSEIIQSYILSLAVNFHPYEVAFLLIDYKGGGMAGLFKNLPHLLGTITNLDGAQSMRAMASIKSELSRRQKIFNKYEVNHINSYNKLFKAGEAEEPLPHLFLISDEFAELKKEQPEFMTELVSAARIGRSLGVHLILATQKPTGVVDDQIWTNSKFKLALKVQNEADSKEILKTPDAANITQAGRAYLQVGNNEIYELFQSAWSGAAYSSEQEEEKIDDRVYVINELGQGEVINPDLSGEEEDNRRTVTQLDALVDYVDELYNGIDTKEVKRPWLPPLKEHMITTTRIEDANESPLNLDITLGLIDIPEEQAQEAYHINLEKEGNILYLASAGYGKTMFLTTALLTIAMHNDVNRVNFYILDFGNSGLIALNRLRHTADYIAFDDAERFAKLRGIIEEEIQKRKKLLAEAVVQNFEVYNQVSEVPMKAIIIVMDNADVIKELGYEAEGFFTKVTRDGYGLGIYVIATATKSTAMKYAIYNNFKNKIAGYLFDESDVNTIVGRSVYKPSEIKGRTLIKKNNRVSAMQLYTAVEFESEREYNGKIEALIEEINAYYPDKKAPRIPVLPEQLRYEAFEDYERSHHDILLGLEKESVQLCGFDRSESPFVILGGTAKGKTNAIKVILEQIAGTGEITLFDSASMELYGYRTREQLHYVESAEDVDAFLARLEQEIADRSRRMQEMLREHMGVNPRELVREFAPHYIVSDDWDCFVERTKAKAMQTAPLLQACGNTGISIILSAHTGKVKGFDEVTKFAKSAVDGLLLSAPGTTGMFQVTSQSELPQFADGLLFHNGTYRKLRMSRYE